VLLLLPTPSRSSPLKKLSLPQAVQAAERFIALNGYTDRPPTEDRTRLSYEFIGLGVTARHNTLERKAYAYKKGRFNGERGWTVIFRYKKAYLSKCPYFYKNYNTRREQGRAVTMDVCGRSIRMEHTDTDPYVQAFTRLKSGKATDRRGRQ
jgi:hypothetical protein